VQIIHTVKYADNLVLLAKEEPGRCCGMEMNEEKSKINENIKKTVPSQNYVKPKTTRKCGIFEIFG
jgi:hypothetical protein